VIFSRCESDIKAFGFSDIVFAFLKLPEGQYHSALAEYHYEVIELAVRRIQLIKGANKKC
jgi:hypothetical protein